MDVGGGVGALGAVAGSSSRALVQLCGEVLLQEPPTRQPGIVRAGAAVGLELLDLLLNPDHVVRATEQLTLRNTLILGRRVHLDIALDRLSRRNEEKATQLSALISGRMVSNDDRVATDERLWLPLDSVPRPLSVPVMVSDSRGRALTRPPQREVRLALEAALHHILRESLQAHPDFGVDDTAVHVIMNDDVRACWLLQSALVAVCETGPGTHRSAERQRAVARRLPGIDIAGLHAGGREPQGDPRALRAALDQLVQQEKDDHRTVALAVLHDALAADEPFLGLVDLVHRHDFVVASLDRSVRDQSVEYDLPDSEAQRAPLVERSFGRARRMMDPREHNYTVHMLVPLPENLPQYNLCVRAPAEADGQPDGEVSLIAAIHYDGHPGQGAIDAISACADELARTVETTAETAAGTTDEAEDDGAADAATGDPGEAGGPGGPGGEPDPRVRKVQFIAASATAALDRLERIVDLQDQATDELAVRWARASTWTVRQSVSELNDAIATARWRLRVARHVLDSAVPATVHRQAQEAACALRSVVDSVEHRLLALQLVSSEVPGQEVGRIRINQARLASRFAPHPRLVEVWATVSDEAQPYFATAVVQPLGLAALVYIVGSLLLDTARWPVYLSQPLTTAILSGGPDAIVAVLLLIPAFAMATTGLPERRSVAGVLRQPARLFVFGAVVMLCLTAIMVSTQVGTQVGDPHDQALHPHLMLWTFRASLFFFLGWTVWAALALALRRRFVWRPKGLRSLFGTEMFDRYGRPMPDSRLTRLRRLFAYARKTPDAEFDLSLPSQSFPAHRREL
jgi:hypothetical protein